MTTISVLQKPLFRLFAPALLSGLTLSAANAAIVTEAGPAYVDETAPPSGWSYLRSTAPTGGTETPLTPNVNIGNGGNKGFGGNGNFANAGFKLPNLLGKRNTGAEFEIFNDGFHTNQPIEGMDLLMHPGNPAQGAGDTFVIARYTLTAADMAHGSRAIVTGSFRNMVFSADSVTVYVYHNGTQLFTVNGNTVGDGRVLTQADGTFDLAVNAAVGDTFSFVVGSNGNLFADETALRATIEIKNDSDADGLDDAWENTHFGNITSQDGAGDPDGDGYTNRQEEYYGTDPNASGGTLGYFTREIWTGVPGVGIIDLTQSSAFQGAPNTVDLVPAIETELSQGDNYGSRLRGTVTAPVTGSYTFWVSGDDNVELWLSSDNRKFNRQRIAWHGGFTGLRQWDKYGTQQSAPVCLQAGQKYYLEVLHKEGAGGDHVSVAWSYEADDLVNWALDTGAVASQSTTLFEQGASIAIDGVTGGDWRRDEITHTDSLDNSWWQVDLGADRAIERVVLFNRTDCCQERLSNFRVSVLDASGNEVAGQTYHAEAGHVGNSVAWDLSASVTGRTVRVEILGRNLAADGNGVLSLAEVQVMGSSSGAANATPVGYLKNWTQESGVTATQSTTDWNAPASNAIDGNRDGNLFGTAGSVSHTDGHTPGNWWEVDLGAQRDITRIAIYNRTDCCQARLSNFRILLYDAAGNETLREDFYPLEGHAGYQFKWDLPAGNSASKVRIQSLGLNRENNHVLSFAEVEILGPDNMTPGSVVGRELIPSGTLESFANDPEDQDDDYLLDTWETIHGFDPTTWQTGDYANGADPDGDLFSNQEEAQRGLDPFRPDSVQGFLTVERRDNISSYSVRNTAAYHDKYYQTPDATYLTTQSATYAYGTFNVLHRLRGYIEAPETGAYQFWVASSDAAQIWLSTDDGKFRKRLLAETGPEVGTSHGYALDFFSPFKWDQHVSQMSVPVQLEEGKRYFIELIHQQGHGWNHRASVAWARPGGEREYIPSEYMYSYHQVADDADDDYLLDSWEQQYGLSTTDNGLTDRDREGEFGDFDQDGLNNREEFLAGTNPANADSDGDGLADGAEVNSYGTDPLASDAPSETVVSTLALTSFTSADATWNEIDGSLLSNSFRGNISWDFTVPTAGTWIIHVDTTVRGTVYANETVPVNVTVDGKSLGRMMLRYGNSHRAVLRIPLLDIAAGGHSLNLEIDNLMARRTVQIESISVRSPQGLDANNDGIPDWVMALVAEKDYVKSHASSSKVSPFFIEGSARDRGATTINGQAIIEGTGREHWFSDLTLQSNGLTTYTVDFSGGAQETGQVTWVPTDVVNESEITIRKGGSLLLTGIPDWNKNPMSIHVDLSVDGAFVANYKAGNPHAYTFSTAGTYNVTVACRHGNKHANGQMTVIVREADLPDATTLLQNSIAQWTLQDANVARDLFLESGAGLGLGAVEDIDGSSYRVQLNPSDGGDLAVVARLWEDGPILDVARISSIVLTDALQNDLTTGAPAPGLPGYVLLTTPMLVQHLPDGAYVVVTAFRDGVSFSDGTKVKTFYNSDLDNGLTYLSFLMPADIPGGYCHYIDVYDANGNHLGRR